MCPDAQLLDERWSVYRRALRGSPLDLHEGICGAASKRLLDPVVKGCPRWPESLRLKSSRGELVKGRCKATNQCSYCAKLSAVETAEMLALDALHGTAPNVWAVLTTARQSLDPSSFYNARREVVRELRKRWPAQYGSATEYTTGYGDRSGGRRRPHFNLLLKGVPTTDLEAARAVIVTTWCKLEAAAPAGQFVGEVSMAGGLMRYLSLHFQKEDQKPPAGWKGHRWSASRGYLWTGTTAARAAARESLRESRELWRAIRDGYHGQAAEDVAQARSERAQEMTWELIQLSPHQLAAAEAQPPHTTRHDQDEWSLVPGALAARPG